MKNKDKKKLDEKRGFQRRIIAAIAVAAVILLIFIVRLINFQLL